MSFLKKTISFIAVLAIMPAAIAVTARPSILGSASARMPTMSTNLGGGTTTTTSSATLANQECINAYTDCLKGGDVCGSGFEECTNKTLFYAKKSQCASTLLQCQANAVTTLFGTSNQTSFSNKTAAGDYVYPTNGSVLGQLIEAGYINNRYDTSNCVRRYTSCLKKDDVCGADFELCTSNTEFKKQKLFCESTLARCQNGGLSELFGTTNTSANPTAASRIGIMISEGGALAAVNAVATCYKVADQCILNTCAQNPYKCKEGSNKEIVKIVENINNTDGTVTTVSKDVILGAVNRSEISGFIKNSCIDTIGSNKFCYATFLGNGVMPTNAQLRDEDNKDAIYSEAYSSRMNDSMRTKIDDLVEKFDRKTKNRCSETIVSCAMRSCGQGSGAACYASAFNSANTIKGVTNPNTMADIKYGCESVVNNDTSCKYSAATFDTATGVIDFEETSLFDKLFTSASSIDAANPDAVGAVATLNSKLSTSYNQAALDSMKKQCQTIATGCVKSMCGPDYQNCYRNRTDVYSSLTQTGSQAFDKSMNKVGGVLDHTIVLGLCLNTVKNTPICEEHIKSEAARRSANVSGTNSWGAGVNDARTGWLDAGVYSATSTGNVQDIDADGNMLCTTAADNAGDTGRCDDQSGTYIYPKMVSENAYKIAQAERTIFRDLVYDLEVEAQAKYNAKLTKQQNLCLAGNTGGIVGAKDNGSTFMWVKLKSPKVPTSYAVKGLETKQFVASNDIYGSFCRIRVALQSDDKYVQDAIAAGKDWSTAYFAAGDAFTCGSWIPNSALEEISNVVGGKARAETQRGQGRTAAWMTVLGTVVGGVGGNLATNALQKGGIGGLLGTKTTSAETTTNIAKVCSQHIENYKAESNGLNAKGFGTSAINTASQLGTADQATITDARNAVEAAAKAAAADTTPAQISIGTLQESATIPNTTTAKAAANAALDKVNDICLAASGTTIDNSKKKTTVNLIGTGVGAVIGGVLGYTATKSVQNANADKAEDRAAAEWMNEVGKHIRCFIGSEEVGEYGDIISTEIE